MPKLITADPDIQMIRLKNLIRFLANASEVDHEGLIRSFESKGIHRNDIVKAINEVVAEGDVKIK